MTDHPDGRLSIRYKGVELAYHTFDKLVGNQRLGAALAFRRSYGSAERAVMIRIFSPRMV